MKKIVPVTAILLVLNGCAAIPGMESTLSAIRKTEPMVYRSSAATSVTAKCVLENIDEHYGDMTSSIRVGARSNVLEVRAKSPWGMVAVAEIEAAPKGSIATVWISNYYVAKQNLMKSFTKGC